ncbi:MAG: HupE/UreJ family protein [Alphaproteobacteria bacterium]|jgi:urease accessory protein
MKNFKQIATLAVFVMVAAMVGTPALAHTGGPVSGLYSGLTHPLFGLDHLLAMIAVGVWSAALPVNRAWQGPVLFVAMLALGAALGMGGVAFPLVEPGIIASVIILGAMIAAFRFIPSAVGLAAIGGFALLHGHAHGTEAAGAVASYMVGFMIASAALHLAGYAGGRLVNRLRYGLVASGVAFSAAGLLLAVG